METGLFKSSRVKVKQHYKYDCGAACLASVARFYGISESLANIRMICGCTPNGISMQGIIDGAEKLGLCAKGYKSPDKELLKLKGIEAPMIAHITDEGGSYHFVAIYGTSSRKVKVMDPATGTIEEVAHEKFRQLWNGYIIIVTPGANFRTKKYNGTVTLHISSLVLKNPKEIVLALAGSLVCTAAGISTTFLLQQIIDNMMLQKDPSWVIVPGILVFSLMVSTVYVGYASTRYLIRFSLKIETIVTAEFINKLFRLPMEFFRSYTAGDITTRIDDIRNIRGLVTNGILEIVTSVITVAGALALMFLYNPSLTLYICAFLPVYWGLFKLSGYMNRRYSKEIADAHASFESNLLQGISGIESIRHYGAFGLGTGLIGQSFVRLAGKMQKCANAVNIFESAVQGVSKALVCIIITIGSAALLKEEMSIGELAGFYSLCTFFTVPLNSLVNANRTIASAKVSAERIFEIVNMPDEEPEQETLSPATIAGPIAINNVSFRFPGRENLFSGISFSIEPHKITLLKGESGCGKSTLVQLILRYCNADDGFISYGGINISRFSLAQWRKMIGYVPQRPHLFSCSILNNITLNEDNPNIKRVMQICSSLNMEQMIERFPQGLLTPVACDGANLSGGERQKICIARAIYRNPDIFIFDEATSSLDRKSEECVLDAIVDLKRKGKTVIFISHKEENFRIADNIVTIN